MTGRDSLAVAAWPAGPVWWPGAYRYGTAVQYQVRGFEGCTRLPYCPAGHPGSICRHGRAVLIMTCHYLRAAPGQTLLHHCPQAIGVKLIIRTDIIDKRWYATVIKA